MMSNFEFKQHLSQTFTHCRIEKSKVWWKDAKAVGEGGGKNEKIITVHC